MENIFVSIYRFLKRRRLLFWCSLLVAIIVFSWRATCITFEEDITRIFPNDDRVARLDYVFRNSKLAERLVVMISVRDSSTGPQPDSITAYADEILVRIGNDLRPHIKEVKAKVEDDKMLELFDDINQHLPVFLDEDDYVALDSLTKNKNAYKALEENYRQLISPTGIVTKKIIVNDPLGISFLVLRKLQRLQYNDNFELYSNYILTRDHRHLLFFIQPVYNPGDTRRNGELIDGLDKIIEDETPDHPELNVSYFGAAAVAVGNARQLQADSVLTISLTVVLLMIVLLGYFRKKRVPFIMLIPVLFGGLFALTVISLFKTSLSILALAVGSVILGVAVDYSLHYLVMLKDLKDVEKALNEVVKPLTIGSFTTVFAFFCLQFTSAAVLKDIGLFAGLSLVGAALCSLTILPQLIGQKDLSGETSRWFARVSQYSLETYKPLVYIILLLTPVFFFLASSVQFNKDMNRLNFMTEELKSNEKRLEAINKSSLNTMYVVSTASTFDDALRKNEASSEALNRLQKSGLVDKVTTMSTFLISDSAQTARLARWNAFWTNDRKMTVDNAVQAATQRLHFSTLIARNVDSVVSRKYEHLPATSFERLKNMFFDDYIIEKDSSATIITLVNVPQTHKAEVYASLKGLPSARFDRQMLTNTFVEYVNTDFTFIVSVTSALVFLALWISLGRIELTLVTFLPMMISWIWILGIMALVGIEFNIVNVMVSTFIFGLGDDYSIFIMDGLQQEYRAGKRVIGSIRTSIYLSAFTTICGLGVLIFAKHPALKSIAAISIIGIASVFLMAQTLEPFLFRWLISNRTKHGYTPITFKGVVWTTFTYGFFVFGSFVLTLVGLLLKIVPLPRKKLRYLYHYLISMFTSASIYTALTLKKKTINKFPGTYSRPSVVICNHTSFLDILLTTMQHPKVILLTNKWVWNSPVFGGVVRMADYYPVTEGAEDSIERLRARTQEGYSIVVFPEGTRSYDGKIKRFHKGAFYIAESLKLPIQPLLIHGADKSIRKGEIYINDSVITLKYLPPIEATDQSFGKTYSERTKTISKYFRQQYELLAREQETPSFFRDRLISNYIYKGPVLEWYARIKIKLENNYETFDKLIPRKATILDLGCGYGFLDYMLQLMSDERIITGVDYDEEKIETAQHGYLRGERLQFVAADVTKYALSSYDVIIISDVLHYLTTNEQDQLIIRCFSALNSGGKLIIRDGNRDLQERHKGTWLTEFFSVKLLKFNKSRNDLNFISGKRLVSMARDHGLNVAEQDETRYTSNVMFIISKPASVHESV